VARKAGERDYRDGTSLGIGEKAKPRTDGRPQDADRRWWDKKGADCADSMRSVIAALQKAQRPRIQQLVVSARLYGNVAMSSAAGSNYARLLQQQTASRDRITYNAIQEIVDTLVSRVGETKPRPYFLTSGGNYRQQRKAKKLNQAVEGIFYETKTYDVGLEAFRDGAILGDGLVKVFCRGRKIRHQRVMVDEIWVDEIEARYGFPRSMYHAKDVDRDELAGWFPEQRQAIMNASRAASPAAAYNTADMVTVVEGWHLGAMGDDGELSGGKHAIALHTNSGQSAMLEEPDDWKHDFFPFARFAWCKRPVGFWSQGLAEQLQGDQMELNKELWLIQRSMHLAGSFKVFLRNGSKVVKEHLDNDVGAIITHTGEAPQYMVPQPIHPVFFENTNRIIERMRARAGVSQMSTGGQKPAGLNSGKALREFEDIESDRHRSISRQNDNLYLQLAALDVALSQEMAKEGRIDEVRVPGKREFQTIDWKKDVGSLKNSEFVMQCFPVSRLPRDPAGRLQTIQEYIQAGFITPRQGRVLLDFPDIDTIESLSSAQEELTTKTLDDIVDAGEYAPPEPTDDLAMSREMALEYLQRFRLLDLEPERLDLLRRYVSQIDTLQQMAAPPPMPGGAPGAPQAAAAPPPVSDLVPNVPGAPTAAP